jgi:transposase InsO family protein
MFPTLHKTIRCLIYQGGSETRSVTPTVFHISSAMSNLTLTNCTLSLAGYLPRLFVPIIDTVTNFVEITPLHNKTSQHVALQLKNTWLSRYPCPIHCIFDQGGEFIGHEFQSLLRNHGIHPQGLTAKNPQSNALCKRLHFTVGNSLRALLHYNPPQNIDDVALLDVYKTLLDKLLVLDNKSVTSLVFQGDYYYLAGDSKTALDLGLNFSTLSRG